MRAYTPRDLASEQFLLGALRIPQRTVQHRGVDETGHVWFKHVVRRRDLVAELARRMRFADVIGLEKCLGSGLPVARQALADVGVDVAIGEIPISPVAVHRAQPFGKRFSGGIEVDEHESVPRVDRHLG